MLNVLQSNPQKPNVYQQKIGLIALVCITTILNYQINIQYKNAHKSSHRWSSFRKCISKHLLRIFLCLVSHLLYHSVAFINSFHYKAHNCFSYFATIGFQQLSIIEFEVFSLVPLLLAKTALLCKQFRKDLIIAAFVVFLCITFVTFLIHFVHPPLFSVVLLQQ